MNFKRGAAFAVLVTATLAVALRVCTGRRTTSDVLAEVVPAQSEDVVATVVPSEAWGVGHVLVEWPAVQTAQSYTVYRSRYPVDVGSMPVGRESTFNAIATVGSNQKMRFFDENAPLSAWIRYSVTANTPSAQRAWRMSSAIQPVATADARVWGFADTHTHQFADLAFGGDVFWGSAFGDQQSALRGCYFGHGLSFGMPLHRTSGVNSYRGWPRWDTRIHQQMYADWLYRAFQGGLRLMVMLAVNNELLCQAAHGARADCKDWASIPKQLQAAREMEVYVRAHAGGWYHIVSSPEEARATINRGQLAVVLGIEADDVFQCAEPKACTQAEIRTDLQRYYALGVRHFFPIHLADNQFGGMAIFPPGASWNFANKFMNGKWLNVEGCSEAGIEFDANRNRDGLRVNVFALTHHLGYLGNPPKYDVPPGHCNREGLTPRGRFLIDELFAQHFIVDVDHMSRKAADEALTIAERWHSPVVAGHTTVLGALRGQRRSEYAKTDEQLRRISALGGLVSIGLAEVGRASELNQPGEVPRNNCSSSSAAWAQPYVHAVSQLGGPDTAAVGVSTDQSFVSLIGPRFGPDACQGGSRDERQAQSAASRVTYPIPILSPRQPLHLPASLEGKRTFDFNVDGMAHIGMYPDFFADLLQIGLRPADLQPIFRSADQYIALWERVQRQ